MHHWSVYLSWPPPTAQRFNVTTLYSWLNNRGWDWFPSNSLESLRIIKYNSLGVLKTFTFMRHNIMMLRFHFAAITCWGIDSSRFCRCVAVSGTKISAENPLRWNLTGLEKYFWLIFIVKMKKQQSSTIRATSLAWKRFGGGHERCTTNCDGLCILTPSYLNWHWLLQDLSCNNSSVGWNYWGQLFLPMCIIGLVLFLTLSLFPPWATSHRYWPLQTGNILQELQFWRCFHPVLTTICPILSLTILIHVCFSSI